MINSSFSDYIPVYNYCLLQLMKSCPCPQSLSRTHVLPTLLTQVKGQIHDCGRETGGEASNINLLTYAMD